ncbi:MAG: hypothetical protein IJZ94_01280 [Clostridia bacterium]|nr:hypothetical protein [Clostridia bacterium]
MKKILVLILTVVVLASSFVMPSMAATEPTDIGGFDFYSITFHYSEPMVVNYEIKEREYVDDNGKTKKEKYYAFGEAVDSYTIYVTENNDNQLYTSQSETEIKRFKETVSNFFAVESYDLGIGSSELAYTKYPTPAAYITQIHDNTAIMIKDTSNIYGLADFYDQADTKNPNFAEQDGYFIDSDTGNKIDDNGFVIDANNLWHEADGVRVEAFTADASGTLIWVPYASRVVDGKALVNSQVTNSMLIEKGLISAYPEYDDSVDYDEDGTVNKSKDKKEYESKKSSFEAAYIQLYRIKTDTDGNKTYSEAELAAANDINRTFTQDDVEVFTNAAGVSSFVRGTPTVGIPKAKATITSVTVEIDALGTQLYSDVAADPQQKNTIVLTTGNVYDNVKFAKDVVAKDSTKINNIGEIIGTAKCVTTKTSMDLNEDAELTKKSVTFDATAETLAMLKNGTDIYLNFNVETLQPTDGVEIADTYVLNGTQLVGEKKSDKWTASLASMTVYKVTEESLESVEVKEEKGNNMMLIIIIAAAAVVVIAVVVIVIVVSKKKKKAIAPVAFAETDAESAAEPEATPEAESAEEEAAEENKED